jgi:hypothetical protein
MRRAALLFFGGLLLAGAAAAQQDWWQRGWGRIRRVPPRFATADSFDGAFNFCRVMYDSIRGEMGGQGWRTDYPDADINFSVRLSELTKTRVSFQPTGEPNHFVVRLTEDDALFQCPFAIIEDAGTASFTDAEVARLRAYLLKGGFLWVDDFWGPLAWQSWVSEIARVLPPAEYPIRDLTPDHALFRTLFEVRKLPQIPSIQFWRQSGGETSERGADSAEPHIRGISDHQGRLMVLMTHNTDIADAWEREGEDPQFFYSFSPDGYAVGINVMMYTMTH